jgi:hypothetical protein
MLCRWGVFEQWPSLGDQVELPGIGVLDCAHEWSNFNTRNLRLCGKE